MQKWSIQVLVLILMSVITYGQTNSFSKIDFIIENRVEAGVVLEIPYQKLSRVLSI